jgi:hypothetical protein
VYTGRSVRITGVVAVVLLAGCPSSSKDKPAPDASTIDASTTIDPVTMTFTPVGVPAATSSYGGFERRAAGGIYGLNGPVISVSTDLGLTWSARGIPNVGSIAATPSAVFGFYAFTQSPGPRVLRSIDDGMTWQTLPLIHPVPQAGSPQFAVTGTALWILMVSTQPTIFPANLARTTNDGASFSDIALPGTFMKLSITAGADGKAYLVGDGHAYRSTDGTVWEDLGQFSEVMYVLATTTVAILCAREAGKFVVYRRATGAAAWTADAPLTTEPLIVARPNGQLARVWFDGTVDESATDGASWTPVVTTVSGSKPGPFALDEVILAVGARLPTGATMWTQPPPVCHPGNVDVSFTAGGTVVAGATDSVATSTDNGQTWRCAAYHFGLGEVISNLSITPDGARIFVGSTLGRSAILAGDGDSAIYPMGSFAGPTEHVRAVQWISNDTLLATTSSDDSLAGDLWEIKPDDISGYRKVYPYRTMGNPMNHPKAGFFGIGECPRGQTFGVALLSSRQWFGTNSYDDKMFFQTEYLRTNDWAERALPFPGPALSISCGAGVFVFVYRENHLFISGTLSTAFHELIAAGISGNAVRAAKIAPDNHLWIVTDQGLFRSATTIVVPP